jgi:hypothetical protein
MDTKDLYARYGELMVQAELIQGQINLVKQQLNEAMSKPATPGSIAEPVSADVL